jgi:hypothetical protein
LSNELKHVHPKETAQLPTLIAAHDNIPPIIDDILIDVAQREEDFVFEVFEVYHSFVLAAVMKKLVDLSPSFVSRES